MTPASKRGSETRDRIVSAAIETVRTEGFANTTARAIAAHGGFNQALIFYHFGSVDELLDEAFGRLSEQQVEGYRAAVVPTREAAYAICSMFLGIELMSRLDPERSEADAVFDMMQNAAGLVEELAPMLFAGQGDAS